VEWTPDDWDPALRFWTLPYDPQLTAWLKAVDPTLASIQAAREFGSQSDLWRFDRAELLDKKWVEPEDLAWTLDPGAADPVAERTRANKAIRCEFEELKMLMQDDRGRYLAEIEAQADGLADYVIAFVGANRARHPWTVELISCALAISDIAYMDYKARFKRVRPSFLCPGLVPALGPPAHPSWPSGHSFAAHLIALFLLEVPGLAQRYGIFPNDADPAVAVGAQPADFAALAGQGEIKSPLLWLARRVGRSREVLGVHYPSDTNASRHLAARVWWALLHPEAGAARIQCPTLRTVLLKARAEWPDRVP
jgi:membrane-associated phospholipid phosphatase